MSVTFGVATVVALWRWLDRRLGMAPAIVASLLAALSPVHVRYSQELRPYSLALLLLVLAIWRFDASHESR